ncbi:TonB-dependent receptor domain-containing protein, partial [Pseudomonas sp. YuFO8]
AQAQNTSRFSLAPGHDFRANYGLEFYYDKATSDSSRQGMEGVTPAGNRSVASLFANLTYDYDGWLTLEGGLRYDRYRLRGQTGLSYPDLAKDGQRYTIDNPCKALRLTGCSTTTREDWDVDRDQGKLSPTLAVAVRPGVEWLEL